MQYRTLKLLLVTMILFLTTIGSPMISPASTAFAQGNLQTDPECVNSTGTRAINITTAGATPWAQLNSTLLDLSKLWDLWAPGYPSSHSAVLTLPQTLVIHEIHVYGADSNTGMAGTLDVEINGQTYPLALTTLKSWNNSVAITPAVSANQVTITRDDPQENVGGIILCVSLPSPSQCATFISEDFTSNRSSALPNNRLQVVVWYDGKTDNTPLLKLEYVEPSTGAKGWIVIGDANDPGGAIDMYDTQIETREYDLGSCQLTGAVEVSGVVANGIVNGMAFGLSYKDTQGRYQLLKSYSHNYQTASDYVGAWPISYDRQTFSQRTQQLFPSGSWGFAHEQASMIITGAKYLDNGTYDFSQVPVWP